MKLRIVSDGTPKGTFILDNEGNVVEGVVGITWEIRADRLSKATIVLDSIPVDVFAEGEI